MLREDGQKAGASYKVVLPDLGGQAAAQAALYGLQHAGLPIAFPGRVQAQREVMQDQGLLHSASDVQNLRSSAFSCHVSRVNAQLHHDIWRYCQRAARELLMASIAWTCLTMQNNIA